MNLPFGQRHFKKRLLMPPTEMGRGWALRCYLTATYLVPLIAPTFLQRRLKRGKEHPERWVEKQGRNLTPKPDGKLIWLHAVGLGEVLSVRGLIERLSAARPDLSFLVTSGTAASASVFAKNAPPRTIHQFFPLDAPSYRRRFLDHFKPNICVWVEQDLWPGMVSDLSARGIPQCIIAARMNAKSHQAHQKASGLYRDLYAAMALITAQDDQTAQNLSSLGAKVTVTGSLKPAAPVLSCDMEEYATFRDHLAGRRVWAVAPAHSNDIEIAQAAHAQLCKTDPSALLIIAPRFPDAHPDFAAPRRSQAQTPSREDDVWLFDTMGELGLVYRLADTVLIGGTFSDIEGHNPWEAAALDCAILHGPRTANFASDFAQLSHAKGAALVQSKDALAAALAAPDLSQTAVQAAKARNRAAQHTDVLADQLLDLLGDGHVQ